MNQKQLSPGAFYGIVIALICVGIGSLCANVSNNLLREEVAKMRLEINQIQQSMAVNNVPVAQ